VFSAEMYCSAIPSSCAGHRAREHAGNGADLTAGNRIRRMNHLRYLGEVADDLDAAGCGREEDHVVRSDAAAVSRPIRRRSRLAEGRCPRVPQTVGCPRMKAMLTFFLAEDIAEFRRNVRYREDVRYEDPAPSEKTRGFLGSRGGSGAASPRSGRGLS
jgi:hypothetical protein